MSKLVVITFDNVSDAREARRALDNVNQEFFELIDAAVVTVDANGRVDVDNDAESSTRTGALVGALLGSVLILIFPLVGAVLGAIGGAFVGKAVEPGIKQSFADEVAEALKPGGSALCFIFHAYEKYELPDVIAALRPFKGTVYQTTLSPEGEKALRQALA
jgi:uncharacterized membrane protein